MPRLNRIFGYNREPIQGHDDIGLWTEGQRVRKESEAVKKHAQKAFADVAEKVGGVGSALGIIKDPRASDFNNLMLSERFVSRMELSEKESLETVKKITEQVVRVLENPVVGNPDNSGPTGALGILREKVTPAYDATCPARLPDQIALLVDVAHEAKQYRNKEKRLMSRNFIEFAKHEIPAKTGLTNTATDQILALKEAAGRLKEDELTSFLGEYNSNAIVAGVLLEALKKGKMDDLKEFLSKMDMKMIREYSPYRNYNSGTAGTGSSSTASGTGPTTSTSSAGAITQNAAESKVIAHFNEEKDKLLVKLKEISSKADKEKIADVNHNSVALIKGINSMLDVLSKEEKDAMDIIVQQIHLSFSDRAERIGLKVNYINNVGKHDFSKQDAEDAFAEWKEDMRKWQKEGDIKYSHQNGKAYSETDLDKFLEERREEFSRLFNGRKGLYNLRRNKGYDADVIEGDGNNSAPVM